jgi:nucleoside-diphosphate-sugar epimerase
MLTHLSPSGDIMPARVVVIGAVGFVGGAVATRLRAAGIEVLELGRAEVDLLRPGAAEGLAGRLRCGDTVVAAAARAPCRDLDMLIDNLRMVRAMLSAFSRVALAHVVNISSDAVYADGPVPLDETSPTAPETLHGAMHLAREIAFRTSVSAPLAIVRPSLLYGAADPHNGYGPNRFRRLAAEGRDIVLFGEGEERRDHVLVEDLADLVYRVVVHRSAGVLNVASGEVHSFREIAERVVALAPRQVAIRTSPRQGPMPHNGYRPFDIALCKRAFPDFAYTPLGDGLARVQRAMETA